MLRAVRRGKQRLLQQQQQGYGFQPVTSSNNHDIITLDLVRDGEVVLPFHSIYRSNVVAAATVNNRFELFSEHNSNISLLREGYVLVALGYTCEVTKDKAFILDAYLVDNSSQNSLGYSYFFNSNLGYCRQHSYTVNVYKVVNERGRNASIIRQSLVKQRDLGMFECLTSLFNSYNDLLQQYDGPIIDIIQEVQAKFQYIMKLSTIKGPIITVIPDDNYIKLDYLDNTTNDTITELAYETGVGVNIDVLNYDLIEVHLETMLDSTEIVIDPESVVAALTSSLTEYYHSVDDYTATDNISSLTIRDLYVLQQALDNLALDYHSDDNNRLISYFIDHGHVVSDRTSVSAGNRDNSSGGYSDELSQLLLAAGITQIFYPSAIINYYVMIGLYGGLF